MITSIIFARLLSVLLIVVAIGLMRNPKTYQKMMEDYAKNSSLIYLGGVFALFFGMIVISLHNVWMLHWPILITLWGWCAIVKGIWLIIFPETVAKFIKIYKKNKNLLEIQSVGILVIGLGLAYFGYVLPW